MNHQSHGPGTQGNHLVLWNTFEQRGTPYTSARDAGFSLTGPINWAGRTAQVEANANTVQEGHQAIADAVMEKK